MPWQQFRCGHPGCPYSGDFAIQSAENDAVLVGQGGRGGSEALIFPPKIPR
ncbi:MAG: hypothetical protein GX561_08100 [Lentisphaerae bacterium]|nr:hypothetical protein [Lentisphaerota bacterium]